jgi:hypothetical protein
VFLIRLGESEAHGVIGGTGLEGVRKEPAGLEARVEPAGLEARVEPAGLEARVEPAGLEARVEPAGLEARVEPAGLEARVEPAGLEARVEPAGALSGGGRMKRAARIGISAGALVFIGALLAGGYWLWASYDVSAFRRALPHSATHVREKHVDLFPDHILYLSAKMSRSAYRAYVEKLRLRVARKGKPYPDWVTWQQGPNAPSWWLVSPPEADVAFSRKGDVSTVAGYVDRTMYLVSWSS